MATREYETLELTHELRLRRWARQNHVPAAERLDSWHPVILDEMDQRDRELFAVETPPPSILPLEMTYGRRIDAGHSLTAPNAKMRTNLRTAS